MLSFFPLDGFCCLVKDQVIIGVWNGKISHAYGLAGSMEIRQMRQLVEKRQHFQQMVLAQLAIIM